MKFPETFNVLHDGIARGDHFGGHIYVSQKRDILLDEPFGFSDIEKQESYPDKALMLWRSAGKPITAASVAYFLSRGQLSLEQPVADFIPEFSTNGKNNIQIKHLLNHTAGIRHADKISEAQSWDSIIQFICDIVPEPDWDPGVRAGYHIAGTWYLLGEICQRLAKSNDYSSWVKRTILEPLGMSDSYIGIPNNEWTSISSRIQPIFITSLKEASPHPYLDNQQSCCGCRPGGNARGPIRDLARFYEFMLGWTADLPELREALQGFIKPSRSLGMMDETFRHKMDWGSGFMLNSIQYGEMAPYGFGKHAGQRSFGHGGAQCSCGFADPENDIVVVWAFNGMPGEIRHNKRVRELNTAIYSDLGFK